MMSETWRRASVALARAQEGQEAASLAAARGDMALAWLWLHAASRSAEVAAKLLAGAAETARRGA